MSSAPQGEAQVHHRVERFAHAVYGLILLTAGVGELAAHDELPPSSARVKNALDQLTLAVPAAVAIGVMLLAEADVIGLSAAYTATLTLSLVALFAPGVVIGNHRRWPLPATVVLGLATAAVDGVVVAVEASAAH